MNSKERAVLWIGLILVALNLAMKWPQIRSIIFTGSGSSSGGTGSGSGSGGGNSITVPIDPFITGPTAPKVTIPLPNVGGIIGGALNSPQSTLGAQAKSPSTTVIGRLWHSQT